MIIFYLQTVTQVTQQIIQKYQQQQSQQQYQHSSNSSTPSSTNNNSISNSSGSNHNNNNNNNNSSSNNNNNSNTVASTLHHIRPSVASQRLLDLDEATDLEELEQFAKTFKQRRIKLGKYRSNISMKLEIKIKTVWPFSVMFPFGKSF